MIGLVFLIAMAASVTLTPVILLATKHLGLYDVPTEPRRVHTAPTPRLGGAAIFAAVCLSLLVARLSGILPRSSAGNPFLISVLGGGGLLFAVGLIDDLIGVRPALKLVGQLGAALLVYGLGMRVESLSLGPYLEVSLGWMSLPLTILWIVGVTNAFNLIDGLDGLATGIGIVALGTVMWAALVLQNLAVVVVCAALIGSLFGFLRYNFAPARIFLGDSGSLFVGFMLAVLSIYGSLKSATALLVVVPVFALAVPLLDVMFTIGRRWLRGVPVASADARHIHHRLLDLGLDHGKAALTLYTVAAGLSMVGILVAFAPPLLLTRIALIGGALTLALFVYGVRRLNYHEFTEAGTVLASGFVRVRRVIRDQILARDLTSRIQVAASRSELEAILAGTAHEFGFAGMELCEEGSRGGRPAFRPLGRCWKLDFPVGDAEDDEEEDLVLRIWCHNDSGSRPYGAERVARILAPTLHVRLEELDGCALRSDDQTRMTARHERTISLVKSEDREHADPASTETTPATSGTRLRHQT